MELTVKQKINKIQKCSDYSQMAWDWFPPAHSDEYYFISYSHRDYKEVFADIFRLEEQGVHLWYDRELRAGKDWEIEARAHIYDFKCKGVIFYISENSVVSDSIHREIEFVKNSGKSYLSINLPVNGEYMSAIDILKHVSPDISENDEKYKIIESTFGKGVTFLKTSESIARRAERIMTDLAAPPLLKINVDTSRTTGDGRYAAYVTGINDLNVTEVRLEDFAIDDPDRRDVFIWGINSCAFANCLHLEKITLPESLRMIEREAFFNCQSLKGIKIPESVYIIGDYAFGACKSLESVNIPAGVRIIEKGVFAQCSNLKGVNLPENLYSIGDDAFNGCAGLAKIDIPEGVTRIGTHAFSGCNMIRELYIPDSVETIGSDAFERCTSLESISINSEKTTIEGTYSHVIKSEKLVEGYERSTSDALAFRADVIHRSSDEPSVVHITPDGKFSYCAKKNSNSVYLFLLNYLGSDKKVVLPPNIEGRKYSLAANFLYGRDDITEVILSEGVEAISSAAFKNCTGLTHIELPDSVIDIPYEAFFNCISLKSIKIPASTHWIGEQAFSGCCAIEEVEVDPANDTFRAVNGVLYYEVIDDTFGIYEKTAILCYSDDFKIEENTLEIGPEAFKGRKNFTELKIPNSVKKIDSQAFSYCTNLKNLILPNGLESISYKAFLGCSALESIELPDSVEIGSEAFAACKALKSVRAGRLKSCSYDTFSATPFEADRANYEDGALYIGGCLIKIEPGFTGELFVKDGTRSFAPYIRSEGVRSVRLPASFTDVSESTFASMQSLEKIEVDPDNPACCSIDGLLYKKDLTALYCVPRSRRGAIVIEEGVERINDSVLGGRSKITSVKLPNNPIEIYSGAFSGCTALKEVFIGDGLTKLLPEAFKDCPNLERITVSQGNKKYISFNGVVYSKAGTIEFAPPAIKLENFVYPERIARNMISYAFNGTGYYKNPDNWHDKVLCAGDCVIAADKDIEVCKIPHGKRIVLNGAFDGCRNLTKVELPSGIEICSWAFRNCSSLKEVVFGGFGTIGEYAFSGCSSLSVVTLPDSVTHIGKNAFEDTMFILDAETRAGGVLYAGNHVISADQNIKGVCRLREGVKTIADGAFEGCAIKSAVLPKGLTHIGKNAFANCAALKKIKLPESLEYVGAGAFEGCTSLVLIKFGGTVEEWQKLLNHRDLDGETGDYTVVCSNGRIKKRK